MSRFVLYLSFVKWPPRRVLKTLSSSKLKIIFNKKPKIRCGDSYCSKPSEIWKKFQRLEIVLLGKNDSYINCSRLWLTNKIKKLRGIDIKELELYGIFRLVDGDKCSKAMRLRRCPHSIRPSLFSSRRNSS